jgi:hypothetical protein
MGDHLLTSTDDRQSTFALGVLRVVLWSGASLPAVLTTLFLLGR